MKKIFVTYEKCVGCKHCELNCAVEHHPSKDLFSMVGDKKTQVNVNVVKVGEYTFPVSCRHCEPAYCMDACPSGAISRDKETNAVTIDAYMCKACAMCAMVCPFDAISFKETHESKFGRDVAYKCDLCVSRLEEDEKPACVTACKTGALEFRDMEELRIDKAKKDLRNYILGEEAIPENIKLYREVSKQRDNSVGE
ncbi:4Fe-4S dicluster domain-containing protein [Limisalsivibrio acetivorans]|uniref:4Fe-4S dicluster domain-containing protein n=1 Tax=Limisalsivibrio acetivorans TaxID=1304888 RepID=UPI0003B39FD3|nr:4Fe-4S dicluster domain-containing protein [Limisalsivibrio acetivorans]